jgi:hypothetical protein
MTHVADYYLKELHLAHALAEQVIEREQEKSRILFSGYWRAPVNWFSSMH